MKMILLVLLGLMSVANADSVYSEQHKCEISPDLTVTGPDREKCDTYLQGVCQVALVDCRAPSPDAEVTKLREVVRLLKGELRVAHTQLSTFQKREKKK